MFENDGMNDERKREENGPETGEQGRRGAGCGAAAPVSDPAAAPEAAAPGAPDDDADSLFFDLPDEGGDETDEVACRRPSSRPRRPPTRRTSCWRRCRWS